MHQQTVSIEQTNVIKNGPPTMTLNLTMSSFENNIINNFKYIVKQLQQNRAQIDMLKIQIQKLKLPQNIKKDQNNKIIMQFQQNLQIIGHEDEKIIKIQNTQHHQQTSQKKNIDRNDEIYQQKQEKSSNDKIIEHDHNNMITDKKIQNNNKSQQNKQEQKQTIKSNRSQEKSTKIYTEMQRKIIDNIQSKQQQNPLQSLKTITPNILESKIFQIFQRLRNLQQKESTNTRNNIKSFKQLYHELDNNTKTIEKDMKHRQQYQQTIEQLRNQLSQYKLKKESKLMKMMTSNHTNNNSNNNQGLDYIIEKIQFLLKHVKQLQYKKIYQEDRDNMNIVIENIRKKISQNVSHDFFDNCLKSLEQKIYQNIAKYIKSLKLTPSSKDGEQDGIGQVSQLDRIIQQGNQQFKKRVNDHQQKLKDLKEQIQLLKSQIQLNRKERLHFQDDISQYNKNIDDTINNLNKKIDYNQRYIQSVKLEGKTKHLETQNQVIQIQQNLEKINSHIKSYNYAGKEHISQTLLMQTQNLQGSQTDRDKDKRNNPELQNQLKVQQKKYNKLVSKVQQLKEDILALRNELNNQILIVKKGLQKKTDDEQFKKTILYFQQKIKQNKNVIQAIYQSMTKMDNNQSSSVIKKGWTCLVCDKQVRSNQKSSIMDQYRLSHVNSNHDVPLVGSFHRQLQQSLEYKQVYMKDHLNYRGKRLSSLKSNQSRQDLN